MQVMRANSILGALHATYFDSIDTHKLILPTLHTPYHVDVISPYADI